MLNFAPASERNRLPIAEKLTPLMEGQTVTDVLEVGSGSGQHALFFKARWPQLQWQCSELPDNLAALRTNLTDTDLPVPIALNVAGEWPVMAADMLYSANTLHIMGWHDVIALFQAAARIVRPGGWLCVYGPFRYAGAFTTDSNAEFDAMLRARDADSGIRDFEAVNQLAQQGGFSLQHDHGMPANNQLLVWQKTENTQ